MTQVGETRTWRELYEAGAVVLTDGERAWLTEWRAWDRVPHERDAHILGRCAADGSEVTP